MKSLHKTLDIIEAVAKTNSVGIRQLSELTGFPPPTIHRITSTLVERRYLKQDPITRRLSLSIKFLELGNMVQQRFNLKAIARPYLENLMVELKESVNLAVQDGDYVAYLDHVRSDYTMLQLFTKPGARVPLYCTGVGKIFMSRWSPSELDAYLRRTPLLPHTNRTIVDQSKLIAELRKIKALNYAVDNEEMEQGVRCVAAMVVDHRGLPVAAVSVSGMAKRIAQARIKAFAESLKACSRAISRKMGFRDTA
ncbi:MAG: IclR family transcriptional regulator [Deltaproteobacteria bacterium]|nr:IclR family transcriptional regulator [Deltaproteobacteria bacterium]